jgi:hypothetical protein
MGNPTNPNRVIRVKDLKRFKTKLDESGVTVTFASVSDCASAAAEISFIPSSNNP